MMIVAPVADRASSRMEPTDWPDIPYGAWRETCNALHLYAQVVGKYRLARTRRADRSLKIGAKPRVGFAPQADARVAPVAKGGFG